MTDDTVTLRLFLDLYRTTARDRGPPSVHLTNRRN
jgi:hypothetical protein